MNWEAQLNLPPTENPSPYPSSLQSSFSKSSALEKCQSSWGTRDHRDGYLDPKILSLVENLLKNESSSGIHFDDYDKIPVEISESFPQIRFFTDCDVNELLLKNIARMGYKNPTPVQKYAIPVSILRRDLMAVAQTGSGKTAAFLFPMFAKMLKDGPPRKIDSDIAYPIGLILAPTRELAQQLHDETLKFAHKTGIKTLCVFGGTGMQYQMSELKRGVDILVATPGRLIDFLDRRLINLSIIRYLILDEGDRMLDMGFEPTIKRILEATEGNDHETIMSSATFSPEMRKIAEVYMKDYVYLTVGKVGSTSENITQKFYYAEDTSKMPLLLQVLQEIKGLTLIFVERRTDVDVVSNFLQENGYESACIHGEKNQFERHKALTSFKAGRVQFLVATDIASRGLDIQNIENVINYDTPKQIEGYIHRIGRTGRIGRNGLAISFLNSGCRSIFKDLRDLLVETIQEIPEWYEDLMNGMARPMNSSYNKRYGESSSYGVKTYERKEYKGKDYHGGNKENSEWGTSNRSYENSDYDSKCSENGWGSQNRKENFNKNSYGSGGRLKCDQEYENKNSSYFASQNPPYNLCNQNRPTRNHDNPLNEWENQESRYNRKQNFQGHNQGDNQRYNSNPSTQSEQWGSQSSEKQSSYQNSQRTSQNWGSNSSSTQSSQWKSQNNPNQAQNSQRGDYNRRNQWGQENSERGARDSDKNSQWGIKENSQRSAKSYEKSDQWGNQEYNQRDDKKYEKPNHWGGQESSQRGPRNYDKNNQWGGQEGSQPMDRQRRDQCYERSNQWGNKESSQRGADYDKGSQWGGQGSGYEKKFKNSSRPDLENQRGDQDKTKQSLSDWGDCPVTKIPAKSNQNSGWGDTLPSKIESKSILNSGWGDTPTSKIESKNSTSSGWDDITSSKIENKSSLNSGWSDIPTSKVESKRSLNSDWGDMSSEKSEVKSNPTSGWEEAPQTQNPVKARSNSSWSDTFNAKAEEKSNPNSEWGDIPSTKVEAKTNSNSDWGDIPTIKGEDKKFPVSCDITDTKIEAKCNSSPSWDDIPITINQPKINQNCSWGDNPSVPSQRYVLCSTAAINESFSDCSRKNPDKDKSSEILDDWGKFDNLDKQNCKSDYAKSAMISLGCWGESIDEQPKGKSDPIKNSMQNLSITSDWQSVINQKSQIETGSSEMSISNPASDWGETLEEKSQKTQEKVSLLENYNESFFKIQLPSQASIEETKEISIEGIQKENALL